MTPAEIMALALIAEIVVVGAAFWFVWHSRPAREDRDDEF